MNYKDLLQKQLADFSSKGYNRTFTSIYRYQETFPFTKIDLPNEKHQKENINQLVEHLYFGTLLNYQVKSWKIGLVKLKH